MELNQFDRATIFSQRASFCAIALAKRAFDGSLTAVYETSSAPKALLPEFYFPLLFIERPYGSVRAINRCALSPP